MPKTPGGWDALYDQVDIDPDDIPTIDDVAHHAAQIAHHATATGESLGGIVTTPNGDCFLAACPPHRAPAIVDDILGQIHQLRPSTPSLDIPKAHLDELDQVLEDADAEVQRVTRMGLNRAQKLQAGDLAEHIPALIEDLRRGLAAWHVLTAYIEAVGHNRPTMPDDLQEARHTLAHALCTDLVIAHQLHDHTTEDD